MTEGTYKETAMSFVLAFPEHYALSCEIVEKQPEGSILKRIMEERTRAMAALAVPRSLSDLLYNGESGSNR